MDDPELNPNIPDYDFTLTTTEVKANPRKLKTKWSIYRESRLQRGEHVLCRRTDRVVTVVGHHAVPGSDEEEIAHVYDVEDVLSGKRSHEEDKDLGESLNAMEVLARVSKGHDPVSG